MEESQDMYDDGSGITMMMITTTMPQKNLWMMMVEALRYTVYVR